MRVQHPFHPHHHLHFTPSISYGLSSLSIMSNARVKSTSPVKSFWEIVRRIQIVASLHRFDSVRRYHSDEKHQPPPPLWCLSGVVCGLAARRGTAGKSFHTIYNNNKKKKHTNIGCVLFLKSVDWTLWDVLDLRAVFLFGVE